VGDQIGAGGFGRVYRVTSDDREAVAKFIPKDPGADRELLFENLEDVRNVVPIIDSGETKAEWVLVMPRAERSLSKHLTKGSPLRLNEALEILRDVADALVDLHGRVVHRDLKPENVLLLEGRWCLADFGISRYAEATTAADTQKFALSPPYAAPERWRGERATSATDIYSLGVMGYEMLGAARPFPGPGVEDYREQHLHQDPPALEGIPPLVVALLEECLYKAPGARPTAENVARRLEAAGPEPQSPGLARLQEANREEVSRRADSDRLASAAQTLEEQRRELAESAEKSLTRIGDALRDAILAAAPATTHETGSRGWSLRLNRATLTLSSPSRTSPNPWQWEPPAFDVVSHAELNLRIPEDQYQYEGRSHSLWFCDAQAPGEFAWYETAFMVSPFIARQGRQDPFALPPGEESAKAVWAGMAEYQLAWPFTRLDLGALDEFIDRWAGWFADAANGRLTHPSTMPERQTQGSWRRS
jgi:serine/threonine-protein kinase